MSWDAPYWLIALLLFVPLGWLSTRAIARLRARRDHFVDSRLFRRMGLDVADAYARIRLATLGVVGVLLVLALAGPRVGGRLGARLPGEVPSLVVALDLSKSMGADDLAPDRLTVARDALNELLDNLGDWNAGVVVFTDEAEVFCPLTGDLMAVRTLAGRLAPSPKELRAGTNLEAAVRKGLDELKGRSGALLLVTDGEALAGDLAKAAAEAGKRGIPLYGLGVGTEKGGRIPDGRDLFGGVQFRRDRAGAPVLSHADLGALASAARSTGGTTVDALLPGAGARLSAAMRDRFGSGSATGEGTPLYPLPVGLAVIMLVAETLWRQGWLRSFALHLHLARLTGSLQRAAGLLLAMLTLTQLAWTWPWVAPREVRPAAQAYRKGDWKGAIAPLERAAREHPEDARVAYDLGSARYQTHDYAGAAAEYERALKAATDAKTEAWIRYDLGNARYRQGEAGGDRRTLWTRAVEAYDAALKLDPHDRDARYNRDLVKNRLAALPPPPGSASKPSGGSSGNGQQGAGQAPAPNLPSEAEVRAMLDALQHEEQQAPPEAALDRPASEPQDALKDLLKKALESARDPDRPDW